VSADGRFVALIEDTIEAPPRLALAGGWVTFVDLRTGRRAHRAWPQSVVDDSHWDVVENGFGHRCAVVSVDRIGVRRLNRILVAGDYRELPRLVPTDTVSRDGATQIHQAAGRLVVVETLPWADGVRPPSSSVAELDGRVTWLGSPTARRDYAADPSLRFIAVQHCDYRRQDFVIRWTIESLDGR
jgi:hypothetical protein